VRWRSQEGYWFTLFSRVCLALWVNSFLERKNSSLRTFRRQLCAILGILPCSRQQGVLPRVVTPMKRGLKLWVYG